MTLLAVGSLQNVYAALDAYITTHLITDAGLAVRLHGIRRFMPPADAAWVEVHYDFLGLQGDFRRQTGRYADDALIYATERQGNLQLNIYQRARVWATRYTTAEARDAVIAAFPEAGLIPIPDSVGGTEAQGMLILDGSQEHVQDTGIQSGIIQHVVQVKTRYLEHYTR
ncbi:MAG TPA: hypothetical protein VI542_25935 [Candidatus Tectomicrobia bacterium]